VEAYPFHVLAELAVAFPYLAVAASFQFPVDVVMAVDHRLHGLVVVVVAFLHLVFVVAYLDEA
jgi:hypothetical protein